MRIRSKIVISIALILTSCAIAVITKAYLSKTAAKPPVETIEAENTVADLPMIKTKKISLSEETDSADDIKEGILKDKNSSDYAVFENSVDNLRGLLEKELE